VAASDSIFAFSALTPWWGECSPLHDAFITVPILYVEWKNGGGWGGSHRLCNIDPKIQQYNGGDTVKDVLNAKNGIDQLEVPYAPK